MKQRLFLFCLLAYFCWPLAVQSKVTLPQLLQSGMVLQRGKPIPIWGTADPGESVIITFRKKQYQTTADAEGYWRLDLPAQKAGGPFELKINELTLTDVLVGDVWLCSGQSNIDVTIERVYPQYPDEIDRFDNNLVRLFRVQNETNTHSVQDDIKPTSINWKPLNKQNAWLFSAVGSFLGLRMQKETGVPQGIIVNSWGGTPIEAWISADSLQRDYPLMVEKTRLYQDDEMVKAQQEANQRANNRWMQLLNERDPFPGPNFQPIDQYELPKFLSPYVKNGQFIGSVYVRQTLHIDRSHAGKPARLLVGTLFDQDYTFVNGREVGRTYYQYPPRRYQIPEGLLHEGENTLLIRFVNKYGVPHFIKEKPYMLIFEDGDTLRLSEQWEAQVGALMPSCPSGDVSLQNLPTTLYNAVLYPLAPYALSGVVWYQGESNAGNPAPYGDLLTKMMGCWRDRWQQQDMPFVIVQLANFMEPSLQPQNSGWAALREQQRLAAKADEHAELACIIDLGETVDIHPLRKKEVAERVGLCFDRLVFKKKVQLSPEVVASDVKGPNITLTFDQPLQAVEAFEVELAGADHRFVNATATANGTKLTISSSIAQPCYVRYAWKDNPLRANLRNQAGLPVSSFELKLP